MHHKHLFCATSDELQGMTQDVIIIHINHPGKDDREHFGIHRFHSIMATITAAKVTRSSVRRCMTGDVSLAIERQK